jgi:hypothetical protein
MGNIQTSTTVFPLLKETLRFASVRSAWNSYNCNLNIEYPLRFISQIGFFSAKILIRYEIEHGHHDNNQSCHVGFAK